MMMAFIMPGRDFFPEPLSSPAKKNWIISKLYLTTHSVGSKIRTFLNFSGHPHKKLFFSKYK